GPARPVGVGRKETNMAKAVSVRGVALVPGVSKNQRLYTREQIVGAVAEAQDRIRAGKMIMRSHHDAGDDSTRIVGGITRLAVRPEDGAAVYEGVIAPTKAGKTISKLVKRGHLQGVSIVGQWGGKVRRVSVGGQAAETGESLSIVGVDFT